METEYLIDGRRITSLETFYDEVERAIIPGSTWGRNLAAFDDILRGGFGTPNDGFTLRWFNSMSSKEQLGYAETVRQLNIRLQHCHPIAQTGIQQKIKDAQSGVGATVFDWLLEIIKDHGDGGTQAQDNVRLVLD